MSEDFSALVPSDAVILSASICSRWRDAIGAHLATSLRNGLSIDPSEHEAARNVFEAAQRYKAVTDQVPISFKSLPIDPDNGIAGANLDQEISTAQAMEITGLSARGVTKAIESGRLAAQREGGRWRVSRESAERLKRTA